MAYPEIAPFYLNAACYLPTAVTQTHYKYHLVAIKPSTVKVIHCMQCMQKEAHFLLYVTRTVRTLDGYGVSHCINKKLRRCRGTVRRVLSVVTTKLTFKLTQSQR